MPVPGPPRPPPKGADFWSILDFLLLQAVWEQAMWLSAIRDHQSIKDAIMTQGDRLSAGLDTAFANLTDITQGIATELDQVKAAQAQQATPDPAIDAGIARLETFNAALAAQVAALRSDDPAAAPTS